MSSDPAGEMSITTEGDIVVTRRTVRDLAVAVGFGVTDVTRIVTAASELARNIFKYGGGGVLRWRRLQQDEKAGLELQFIDHGPGIADVELALQEGFTTGRGLGLGLPAAKRLMDDLMIHSEVGKGTEVTVKKWRSK
jgi:serine/threonine-protein kinase RsbT